MVGRIIWLIQTLTHGVITTGSVAAGGLARWLALRWRYFSKPWAFSAATTAGRADTRSRIAIKRG